MKTDNYLTLCLQQAANSPLHYRHGCIIVRGGKVIGQGYNDYRPGFNGGALKTGRLPTRASDGSVSDGLKKRKLKRKSRNNIDQSPTQLHEKTANNKFTPFEGMGGGVHANTPLSMHGEMMAIHSALSAYSAAASDALLSKQPCFKLSGGSKRKQRLRNEALKVYVETVCKAALAESTGSAQGNEWQFEGAASQSLQPGACAARLGGQQGRCGFVPGEQCRETPREEMEERTTPTAPAVST
jgi:deoxycytidylate deaminase